LTPSRLGPRSSDGPKRSSTSAPSRETLQQPSLLLPSAEASVSTAAPDTRALDEERKRGADGRRYCSLPESGSERLRCRCVLTHSVRKRSRGAAPGDVGRRVGVFGGAYYGRLRARRGEGGDEVELEDLAGSPGPCASLEIQGVSRRRGWVRTRSATPPRSSRVSQ
jgi:hypothetical protein